MRRAAYKKTLAVIFLLLLFIIEGCAGRRHVPVNQALISLKKEAKKIQGINYVPAVTFCEIYGLKNKWDIISYKLTLEKNNYTAVLKPQSRIFLVDGIRAYSEEPVIFYKGGVFIPLSLIEKKLDSIFNIYRGVLPDTTLYRIDKIVIDPGHGGKDPGAIGRYGLKEKDVVLDISKRLKKKLEAYGIDIILTRESDVFISLWQRANISNKNKADFFISIHANAARSRRASGFEVYYLSEACDDGARAVEAAENAVLDLETDFKANTPSHLEATLWDIINDENRVESIELAGVLCESMKSDMTSKDRGVKSALFYVLKGAIAPSVLVEVGFVSNREEEAKLAKASYREQIADTLAKGIIRYKMRYEKTNGFTN